MRMTKGTRISNLERQCKRKYNGKIGEERDEERPLGGAVEVCRSEVLDGIEGAPELSV